MFNLLMLALSVIIILSSVNRINGDCVIKNATIVLNFGGNGETREVKHQLELLTAANEVLRMRLETLNLRLEQQTEILKGYRTNRKPDTSIDLDVAKALTTATTTIEPLTDMSINVQDTKKIPIRRPRDCAEAIANGHKSGLYTIQPDNILSDYQSPFLVACVEVPKTDDGASIGGKADTGGWTVVQRRRDGTIDFYRNWTEYKIGFGNLNGEFFIGLDKLHILTTQSPQELLIIMEDFENAKRYAKYSAFAIGNEAEAYALNVLGNYSGDAGDSFSQQASYKFTTKDVDNDVYVNNCAVSFTGAWWYHKCHGSNLNGQYLRGAYSQDKYAQGVVWASFRGANYALKFVQMMIRPQRV